MNIEQIDEHLNTIKNKALSTLGVDDNFHGKLVIAASPNPEMGDWGFPVFALQGPLKDQLKDVPGKARAAKIASMVEAAIEPLLAHDPLIESVSTQGPYVNFRIKNKALANIVIGQALSQGNQFGAAFAEDPKHWVIEFSAPNTNKPQHLGHVRNNLLGQAVSSILEGAGHKVTRVNLINDRGIHICKSMMAYQLKGEGKTPKSQGIKGDHFVGHYYVVFNTLFEKEYSTWQTTPEAHEKLAQWQQGPGFARVLKKLGDEPTKEAIEKAFFKSYKDNYFNKDSALGAQVKAMLVAWEKGDEAIRTLWKTMNQWVFEGFDETYNMLGVSFDHIYYESNTYTLGKDIVHQGLASELFTTIDGGAVACPMKKIGMKGPDKVLLRGDGTSLYMTQDLGTAMQRFENHDMDKMIYITGDEQNHHFKQLFGILGLLKDTLKDTCIHLGYGMIDLPSGRMKSREGTVVDADDLIAENIQLARAQITERLEHQPTALTEAVIQARAKVIGLAGLKFYVLDYNPKTRFVFDPKSSIDPQGRSGVYLLYAYARIHSIAAEVGGFPQLDDNTEAINALGTPEEIGLIKALQNWPHMYQVAATHLDPSKITEGMHDITRAFSTLYNNRDHIVKNMEGPRQQGVLLLLKSVVNALDTGLKLIGIDPIERM